VLDRDLLRATGEDALMKAARRYEPERGPFEGYAWTWISRKMLGALHAERRRASLLGSLRTAALEAGLGGTLEVEAPNDEAEPAALDRRIDAACAGMTVEMFTRFVGGIAQAEGEEGAALREEYAGAVAALGEAMAELSPRRRKLFERRVLHGATWEDIAEAFGVSVSTSKNQYKEIRALLRESLTTKGYTRPPPIDGKLTLLRPAGSGLDSHP
ncbi:MAG: sigma-70 family RNA polymerase sigma factor, partial [Minicystis sp.]